MERQVEQPMFFSIRKNHDGNFLCFGDLKLNLFGKLLAELDVEIALMDI
jgi:hypothetical protein